MIYIFKVGSHIFTLCSTLSNIRQTLLQEKIHSKHKCQSTDTHIQNPKVHIFVMKRIPPKAFQIVRTSMLSRGCTLNRILQCVLLQKGERVKRQSLPVCGAAQSSLKQRNGENRMRTSAKNSPSIRSRRT